MSDGKQPLPGKKDVARALLLKGTVFVHLDPRSDDVVVPAWLKRQPQLVLQVGLDMLIPIPDLRVDDSGVYGTLSFNRNPFTCSVPWHAVFAVVGDDGRGMVWPDSMPSEIAAEVEREARAQQGGQEPGSTQPVGQAPQARFERPSEPRTRRLTPEEPAVPDRSGERPSLELVSSRPPPPLDPDGLAAAGGSGLGRRRRSSRQLPPYLRVVK